MTTCCWQVPGARVERGEYEDHRSFSVVLGQCSTLTVECPHARKLESCACMWGMHTQTERHLKRNDVPVAVSWFKQLAMVMADILTETWGEVV